MASGANTDGATERQDLERSLAIWIAANDAKAERIAQLEQECQALRSRLARLTRRLGRERGAARPSRVRSQAR